jgi:hypothetical protein
LHLLLASGSAHLPRAAMIAVHQPLLSLFAAAPIFPPAVALCLSGCVEGNWAIYFKAGDSQFHETAFSNVEF